jgi:hypothetical protein
MATNMPPPASPARQSTSDGNRVSKRKTREPVPSTSGIFTFPRDGAADIECHLDPEDYVILCIPKALASSLQNFLDKSANTLEGLKIKTPIINVDDDVEEDSAFHTNLSDEFRTTFSGLKSEFSSLVSKYKNTDLAKDVKPELLQEFKRTRTILTRWFTTGQHLTNKLAKPLTHTNDYLKLGFNFSPAVRNDDLQIEITRKIQTLKTTCENLLTDSVVNSSRQKNYEATEILNKVLSSDDPDLKFLVAKIYRCIVRSNQHLIHSTPWVKRPPRQQGPQVPIEPFVVRDGDRDQHVPHTSYEPRVRRPPRQQGPQVPIEPHVARDRDCDLQAPHTSYEPHQSGEDRREPYRQLRVRNQFPDSNELYFSREYHREPYFQQDRYQHHHNQNYRDTYDRDFAPYDREFKQVKERYRKPSTQGRHASKSSALNWV